MMSKMTLRLMAERSELGCSEDGVGWSGVIGIDSAGRGRSTAVIMMAAMTTTSGLIERFLGVLGSMGEIKGE